MTEREKARKQAETRLLNLALASRDVGVAEVGPYLDRLYRAAEEVWLFRQTTRGERKNAESEKGR